MRFKKIASFFFVYAFLLCTCLSACAQVDTTTPISNNINAHIDIVLQINNSDMMVNEQKSEIDPGRGTAPIIQAGRTLVPIRAIIEAFGGAVEWDSSTKSVTLTYSQDSIKLNIDSNIAYINGVEKNLDVAPQIINGRTMIPIRFVAEGFEFDVFWAQEDSCITISNYRSASDITIPALWKRSVPTASPTSTHSSTLKVHFIDVGQGDSIFIELPNQQTMLIDAGPKKGIVNRYISNLGYTNLNYVVATHPDADHISGMPEILHTFSVDKFYMPEKEHTTQIFETMLDAIAANGCDAIYAQAGNFIVRSNDLSIQFVSPKKNYADNNNASAVVRLIYGKNSFLFMGDAETSAEQDIINSGYDISAEVLKVGHHGSNSSTSDAFLQRVKAKYAVISVGKGNQYGHPTRKILTALNNNQIQIYRTDEVGTIVFTCDGNSYSIDKNHSVIQPNAPPVVQEVSSETSNKVEIQTQTVVGNNAVVYRTKTGSKYHNSGCSYLKSKIETTVSEAKSMGLTPCSRCNPPQ